ncbi:Dam family site-specific DNA-(adenine-N6)-methyltransferase [Pedobacter sp. N36a]|uniref:DNA adenine methylase n=1 Tax=Pedobacter sp. N36a TaxID=2767996 RepID=UPI001656D23A|nr:Dam family site-specific DNA-(adenine-N6)-methyltransferase [Pedobacter sp. N36a]MBC8987736.1 Dam family site-specific DNA-(adenine-N6)-methyltransferase [Pedobacter sp. N36a]
MSIVKPFLRWAGGKNWLVNRIEEYLPVNFNNYYEPFLGGGSIYFYLKSRGHIQNHAFLSDLNTDLIETFNLIKTHPNEVIERLLLTKNEKEFYYNIRSEEFEDPIDKAVKFLYLNRTSFNGIYRVNMKGEYNVPFGNRNLAKIFDIDNLHLGSGLLSGATLHGMDFMETLPTIKKGDLIFLDPPYTVAHENNGFVKYNQQIFAWEDQVRLQEYIQQLIKLKAYFIMTNAAHESIENLYSNIGKYAKLKRPSLIGGKGAKRTEYNEFIFTNI